MGGLVFNQASVYLDRKTGKPGIAEAIRSCFGDPLTYACMMGRVIEKDRTTLESQQIPKLSLNSIEETSCSRRLCVRW